MFPIFSNLAVIFTNPYKTAGFLFFDGKEDAKKTDVVKVRSCLIIINLQK